MRYSPKYGLIQNWFMYQENTSFFSPYTRNEYPSPVFLSIPNHPGMRAGMGNEDDKGIKVTLLVIRAEQIPGREKLTGSRILSDEGLIRMGQS
jgi:hypothetical protein